MKSAPDFELASIQATVYTPGLQFIAGKILQSTLSRWSTEFEDEPFSVPSQPNMPEEFPRVILQSKDTCYRLELSPARANLHWIRRKPIDTVSPIDFLSFSSKVLTTYLKDANGHAGRLASVVRRYFRDSEPGKTLARHFCKEEFIAGPMNRPENFELHSHKKFFLAEQFQINSWIRFKSGSAQSSGAPAERIILVEQDFNTLSEETSSKQYLAGEINKFFACVFDEFNTVLSLYFPTRDPK